MLPSEEEFEISVANAASLLKDDAQEIRLVDCREEDEFQFCRIEGAELVPLSRFAELAASRLLEVPDSTPVIVYCHHGMRSMSATQFLRQKGRHRVWSLRGGIDAWSTEVDLTVPRY